MDSNIRPTVKAERFGETERQKLTGEIVALDSEMPPAFLESLCNQQLKMFKEITERLMAKPGKDVNKIADEYYPRETRNPVRDKMMGRRRQSRDI